MPGPIDTDEQLICRILALLQGQPAGLSEYALLQQLRQDGGQLLEQACLSDTLTLFRNHFLLFNGLYRLRDELWQRQQAHLSISALLIQLQPYASAEAALVEDDPLRRYYLDMDNFHSTGADEVQRLLGTFWQRMRGGDEHDAALQLFGLDAEQAARPGLVKRRFRQLLSAHHPDRGGETARLQAINQAREVLQRYYQ